MHHENYESLYPAILDFNHEYMGPQDDMGSLPASYENLVYKLYNYLISPKDKYLKVISRTSFTFEQTPGYDKSDNMYKFWKGTSVKDILNLPDLRSRFVFTVIQVALNRLVESCDDLEKTINPLIINDESKPLENSIGLNTEESQLDMNVVLLEVKTEQLVLQDLQNRVNFYMKQVLYATDFPKKIGGLSLQGLLRYTASAMTSVRSSWIEWKTLSHYSKSN